MRKQDDIETRLEALKISPTAETREMTKLIMKKKFMAKALSKVKHKVQEKQDIYALSPTVCS